jgi:hypothetical protein
VTAAPATSFRGVLALVEKHGTTVVSARSLERIASADVRAALHVASVLAGAPPAASWPCDVRGCSREIRANHDGARRPLLAVCCQAPAACSPIELGFDDVAQLEIAVDALVRAVCALLGATIDRAATAKLRERHALGASRTPILVATTDEPARDLFWAGTPHDIDLAAFCARRERVAGRTLVLVPTGAHVPLDVAARFTAGEHVELMVLADTLDVRGGALALRTPRESGARLEVDTRVPRVDGPAKHTGRGLAAELGVSRWEQTRFSIVDGHTVRIEANGQSVLRTFVELGFVDRRKTEVVTPVAAWGLFLLFCKAGAIRPSEYAQYGKPYGAKKAVEGIGKAMTKAFGLEESPIRRYSRARGSWETRFLVEAEKGARRKGRGA